MYPVVRATPALAIPCRGWQVNSFDLHWHAQWFLRLCTYLPPSSAQNQGVKIHARNLADCVYLDVAAINLDFLRGYPISCISFCKICLWVTSLSRDFERVTMSFSSVSLLRHNFTTYRLYFELCNAKPLMKIKYLDLHKFWFLTC